ncbi:MAG: RNA methyltransferase [Saprospiraceae bacterium]|nr:RNA methyltransferase [Saprospiraceae bacterium]
MRPERLEKFKKVIASRQPDLSVVLENVHDQHNIGAVMRTCDSVGIYEIFVLQTHPDLQFSNLTLGKRTSAGTRKWVEVRYFTDRVKCFKAIREKYHHVFATHLDAKAKSLHELDLVSPTALLFGNEHVGVSEKTLALCDGNFIIPQVGMVQSLNISVACAVSLYEAFRQRNEKGKYTENTLMTREMQDDLLELYLERHDTKATMKFIPRDIRDAEG